MEDPLRIFLFSKNSISDLGALIRSITSLQVPPPTVVTHHGNNANYTPIGPGPGLRDVTAAAAAAVQGAKLIVYYPCRGCENLFNSLPRIQVIHALEFINRPIILPSEKSLKMLKFRRR